MASIAFLDASVLYPAPVRDLLIELATKDLFQAKWTDLVLDEWTNNILRKRPDLDRKKNFPHTQTHEQCSPRLFGR